MAQCFFFYRINDLLSDLILIPLYFVNKRYMALSEKSKRMKMLARQSLTSRLEVKKKLVGISKPI